VPKETFFNLAEGKRSRISAVALDEFATHDYRSASLSRIVQNAGIAKGSMYQYFEDKKDLYYYLVGLAAEAKFNFISEAIADIGGDFFTRYKSAVFYGAQFDFTQAKYGSILYHATFESNEAGISDIAERLKASSISYIRGLIDESRIRGELRNDIDAGFLSYAVYHVTLALREYLSATFSFNFKDAVRDALGSPVPEPELLAVIEDMMKLFSGGMRLR
jgi:AcrR family transcriptional regulator